MGVSSRAATYQKILYIINGFVLSMAIIAMAYASWALHSNQSFALPRWAIEMGLAFSVIVVVISGSGFWGTHVAPNKIANHQTNWFLWFYFIITFLSMVLTIVAAGVILVLVGTIEDTEDQKATSGVRDFEESLRESMAENPSEWMDVQDYFECCGYNCTVAQLSGYPSTSCPATEFPTGKYCPSASNCPTPSECAAWVNEHKGCRDKLLEKAKEQAIGLGVIGVIFALVQLLALVSAFCLLCCVKDDIDAEATQA